MNEAAVTSKVTELKRKVSRVEELTKLQTYLERDLKKAPNPGDDKLYIYIVLKNLTNQFNEEWPILKFDASFRTSLASYISAEITRENAAIEVLKAQLWIELFGEVPYVQNPS